MYQIKQQSISINSSPETNEFLNFLKTKTTQELIIADGYEMEVKE